MNARPHPASISDADLLNQCRVTATRRGGPGGQHRNKVSSAIVITHLPSGVVGQASERRDQKQNRAVAIERLRLQLALAVRMPARLDDGELTPSVEAWQRHLRNQRISVSPEHADAPQLLAQVLDWLAACQWDTAAVAVHLNCSHSQLVKFLKMFPAAFSLLNHNRHELGLNRLK